MESVSRPQQTSARVQELREYSETSGTPVPSLPTIPPPASAKASGLVSRSSAINTSFHSNPFYPSSPVPFTVPPSVASEHSASLAAQQRKFYSQSAAHSAAPSTYTYKYPAYFHPSGQHLSLPPSCLKYPLPSPPFTVSNNNSSHYIVPESYQALTRSTQSPVTGQFCYSYPIPHAVHYDYLKPNPREYQYISQYNTGNMSKCASPRGSESAGRNLHFASSQPAPASFLKGQSAPFLTCLNAKPSFRKTMGNNMLKSYNQHQQSWTDDFDFSITDLFPCLTEWLGPPKQSSSTPRNFYKKLSPRNQHDSISGFNISAGLNNYESAYSTTAGDQNCGCSSAQRRLRAMRNMGPTVDTICVKCGEILKSSPLDVDDDRIARILETETVGDGSSEDFGRGTLRPQTVIEQDDNDDRVPLPIFKPAPVRKFNKQVPKKKRDTHAADFLRCHLNYNAEAYPIDEKGKVALPAFALPA